MGRRERVAAPQPAHEDAAPAAASAFAVDRRPTGAPRRRAVVEPERARVPDADQRREEQPAGEREHEPREAVQPENRHLRREGAVDRAAEQRVGEHAVARVLEAELEDAVVGDRQREEERQAAGPAMPG